MLSLDELLWTPIIIITTAVRMSSCVQELLDGEFDAVLTMSQTQVSRVLTELSDTDIRSVIKLIFSFHQPPQPPFHASWLKV